MRRFAFTVAAALMLTGGPTCLGFTLAWAEVKAAPALSVLPPGYRDWRLISVAHECQPARNTDHRSASNFDQGTTAV